MKIAIISDIHANTTALHKVLDDARSKGCERFICLGDIVGYGPDPNGTIELCRQNDIDCILGNHDAGVIGELSHEWFSETARYGIEWQEKEIVGENRKWLQSLPQQRFEKIDGFSICFSHGTFSHPFGYIEYECDAKRELDKMALGNIQFLFVGHTHDAETFTANADGDISNFMTWNSPDLSVKLSNHDRAIVNVGSVGYPRVQRCSYYVVYDTGCQVVSYNSIPFDFNEYREQLKKRQLNVPFWVNVECEGRHSLEIFKD